MNRNTKQLILIKALELFSERGYDGVSTRDIAGAVGIRESALYKHYSGKQDIFDSILEDMRRRYEAAVSSFHLPQGQTEALAEQYGKHDLPAIQKWMQSIFLFLLNDPYAAQFRRMLTIEQYKNPRAKEMYHGFFINEVLSYEASLFAEMMDKGYFHRDDPALLALEFYGPFFLLLSRCDGRPDREKQALDLLALHAGQFYRAHSADTAGK